MDLIQLRWQRIESHPFRSASFRGTTFVPSAVVRNGGTMSMKVVLEFQTTADQVDAVKDLLRTVLPDTRGYDGFESLTVHQSDDDPTSFLIWEQWATRGDYEAYLAWRTETGVLDKLLAMLTGPPSFRFFNHVGV